MTPERLREIADRHADEVPDVRPGLMAWHPRHAQAHADRGELLDLLRRIARGPSSLDGLRRFIEAMGRGEAPSVCLCFEEPHAPDCPAPALFALL